MKKTILLAFLFLFLVHAVFAGETRVLDSETRVISAYKHSTAASEQIPVTTIRLIDSNNVEFEASEILVTPLDARGIDYPAFSWVLGGNIYGSVSLSFSFGPMWLDGDANTGRSIPYTMTLSHISSKVGNTTLACNKASVSVPISFLGYEFNYADSFTYPNTVSVNTSAGTAAVTYNLNTSYTTVKKNGTAANYPYTVCNYWNRMGLATIFLKINENGVPTGSSTALPDGIYYSTVVITITPET